jgi:hypothetical protein
MTRGHQDERKRASWTLWIKRNGAKAAQAEIASTVTLVKEHTQKGVEQLWPR